MATAYQFIPENLTPGRQIYIRGKIRYSRITRLIQGEELTRSDARRVQNGMSAVGKPHLSISLTEPAVQYEDPKQPTYEDNFVNERFFTSKKNPELGPQYSIDPKGTDLPIIAISDDNGGYTQDTSGRELAQGLDVTILLRVYKPKSHPKCGLALEMVIVNEPVRYYSAGGPDLSSLAARGITFSTQPRKISASEANPSGDVPEIDGDDEGYDLPQPQAAPAAGYPNQDQQAPAQQAPAAAPNTAVGYAPQAQAPAQPQQQTPAQPQAAPAAPAQMTREQLEEQLKALEAQQAGQAQAPAAPAGNPDSAITANPWPNSQRPAAPGISVPTQG